MKKVIFITLITLLCGCTEISYQRDSVAITFGTPLVTKSATEVTTSSMNEFLVWGYKNNINGVFLHNEPVTKSSTTGAWNYENKAYWDLGSSFYFTAIAPKSNAWSYEAPTTTTPGKLYIYNGCSINFGELDLVYADATVAVDDDFIQSPQPVSFSFKHLLARVMLTFKNSVTSSDVKVSIKNPSIIICSRAGVIETPITNESKWSLYEDDFFTGTATIPYSSYSGYYNEVPANGQLSTDYKFVIPIEGSTDEIGFLLQITKGESSVESEEVISLNWNPEMGGSYNIVVDITDDMISSISNK